MFTYEFSRTEAEQADGTSRIKKGGYYKGTITGSEILQKGQGFTLELELSNEAGESTGKQFLTLVTKEGQTVDKNGKALSGRSKLSAMLALLGKTKMESSLELMGKKIGFLGQMKVSGEYLNFEVLNFMDPSTNQTYSEKVKQEPAKRFMATIVDDVKDSAPAAENGVDNKPVKESDLPF
jgi:hypothetical protein